MAHRYLCPICDRELKGMHYCKECRKFIREPVIYHGENLPNVSSTRNYSDYGGRAQTDADMRRYSQNYGRPDGSLPYDKCHPGQKKAAYNPGSGSFQGRTVPQGSPSGRPASGGNRPKQSGGNVVAIVIIIWIIIVFFISFLGAIF